MKTSIKTIIFTFLAIITIIVAYIVINNSDFGNNDTEYKEYGMQVKFGASLLLSSKINFEGYEEKDLVWQSEKPDVVKVDRKGNISIVQNVDDVVTITVFTVDEKYGAKFKIKVSKVDNIISVSGVSLNKENIQLKFSQKEQLTATISPSNATDQRLIWISSDKNFVKVSEDGVIEVVDHKVGDVLIYVKTFDGNYVASCNVHVEPDISIIDVTDIQISPKEIVLNVGKTKQFEAKVLPDNATNKDITWAVGDQKIASVDNTGKIKALSPGSTIITAKSNNDKIATAVIKVIQEVESITISPSAGTINVGSSIQLKEIIKPEGAIDSEVKWTSSDENIATVSNSGVVKGIKSGKVTITAKTANGKSSTSIITVDSSTESITLSPTTKTLNVGSTVALKVQVTPAQANQTIKWSSSDTNIATVTNGIVKAIKPGQVVITAATNSGRIATAKITVIGYVEKLDISPSSLIIKAGESQTLKSTISPSNAINPIVIWSSNNTRVATVSSTGVVKGLSSGTAVITATTSNGIIAIAMVTVTTISDYVTVAPDSGTINVGSTITLKGTIYPSNAINKNITWSSSNSNIATVNSDGVVKGISAGVVTITARSSSGQTASSIITVNAVSQSITISPSSGTINVGSNITLKGVIYPSNAANQSITWSSSNTSIATVNSEGVVTGIKNGTVTITAKTTLGQTASSTINVVSTKETISITPSSSSINVGATVTLKGTVSPSTANQSITWSSSDTNVAIVSTTGVVKGIGGGTAVITAKSSTGQIATAVITVTAKSESISVYPSFSTIYVGLTITLKGTISPSNAINQSISWSSSNSSVASVNSSGVVTGKSAGTAIITAKTTLGQTSTCTVTVKSTTTSEILTEPTTEKTTESTTEKIVPSSIYVSPSSGSIKVGSYLTLYGTINPSNAYDQYISWSSSNQSVATVTSTGVVTGKSAGTAIITAKTSNGKTATATITVTEETTAQVLGNPAELIFLKTQTSDYENGESIILKTATGKVALIDVAHNETSITKTIIDGLYEYTGGYDIDYLILSHDHADHRGGLKNLLKDSRIKVKNIVIKNDKLSSVNKSGTPTYDYVVNHSSNFGYNVITTNNLYDGYTLKLDDYVSINIYNVEDVFSSIYSKCGYNLNSLLFNSSTSKSNAVKTSTGKYLYIKPGSNKINYTTTFTANNGYYWGTIKEKDNCNHNANSLALLISVNTNAGYKYAYIPSDLQNDGYPLFGEKDSYYNTTIYGNGASYGYKLNSNGELILDNNSNFVVDSNIIKIPSEHKVAKKIKDKLGSSISDIVIYQETHHGINNALDAINLLGLNRSGLNTVAMYYVNPKTSPAFRIAYPHLNYLTNANQYYTGSGTIKFVIKNNGSVKKTS